MSNLADRLEKQILLTKDASLSGVLRVRRGCYLARIGRFSEVHKEIQVLRQECGSGNIPRVSMWVILLEGILDFYEKLGEKAYDRIVRAQLLALAFKDHELIALASSWRSHMEFERSNYAAMKEALDTSKLHAHSGGMESACRRAMVIADCFSYLGNRAAMQHWFMEARALAVELGDQASIEALLYNRAAFGLAHLRAQACVSNISAEQISRVRSEIESARNLKNLIGASALASILSLSSARLDYLEGNYKVAISALRAVKDMEPFAKNNFSQELIDLEIIYCKFKSGLAEGIGIESEVDTSELDPDEHLVAVWMKLQMVSKNLQPEYHKIFSESYDQCCRNYDSELAELRVSVAEYDSQPG